MQPVCKTALLALFLLGGAASAPAADECANSASSLEELVELHTRARGGRAAIEAVCSIRYDLHLQEPEFEVDLIVQLMRPNLMRVDVYADGENVYTEAFDGERAWQRNGPGAAAERSGDDPTAALRHATQFPTHLYGLHELEDLGHGLSLKDPQEIDGRCHDVIGLTLDDGFEVDYFLDADSHLIARSRDIRALHPDIDVTKQRLEDVSDDFRDVAGVQRAFRSWQNDLDTGARLQTVTIRRIETNVGIDPRIFQMAEKAVESGEDASGAEDQE